MLKKKCPHCEKKIERKFNFCPYCGFPFKKITEQDIRNCMLHSLKIINSYK